MTETISSFYSDDPFPQVLIYSMLLTILSFAAVGVVSSHVLTKLGLSPPWHARLI
jgi:hypothetical protein